MAKDSDSARLWDLYLRAEKDLEQNVAKAVGYSTALVGLYGAFLKFIQVRGLDKAIGLIICVLGVGGTLFFIMLSNRAFTRLERLGPALVANEDAHAIHWSIRKNIRYFTVESLGYYLAILLEAIWLALLALLVKRYLLSLIHI